MATDTRQCFYNAHLHSQSAVHLIFNQCNYYIHHMLRYSLVTYDGGKV